MIRFKAREGALYNNKAVKLPGVLCTIICFDTKHKEGYEQGIGTFTTNIIIYFSSYIFQGI